jgi:hypothetical protein
MVLKLFVLLWGTARRSSFSELPLAALVAQQMCSTQSYLRLICLHMLLIYCWVTGLTELRLLDTASWKMGGGCRMCAGMTALSAGRVTV